MTHENKINFAKEILSAISAETFTLVCRTYGIFDANEEVLELNDDALELRARKIVDRGYTFEYNEFDGFEYYCINKDGDGCNYFVFGIDAFEELCQYDNLVDAIASNMNNLRNVVGADLYDRTLKVYDTTSWNKIEYIKMDYINKPDYIHVTCQDKAIDWEERRWELIKTMSTMHPIAETDFENGRADRIADISIQYATLVIEKLMKG